MKSFFITLTKTIPLTNIDEIKRLSREGPQNIQIIAKKFWIPWTFLYDERLGSKP
jgi:hypothetical protein